MRTTADTYLSQVNKGNTVRRGFLRAQWIMALLVIPAVFWGLKLTGITMAGEAFCGMDEHVHGDTCVLQEMICEIAETPSHVHTEEYLSTVLNCTLPEQEGHAHGDDCRSAVPICTLEESQGHSHQEACYTREWFCGIPEEPSHSHDETCTIADQVCQLPETEGHTHGSECYTDTLTCQEKESGGHTHGSDCYVLEEDYSCGLEEQQAHTHTKECFLTVEDSYICGLEETEGHTHGEGCYRVLESCPVPEHIHTPNCYSDISADLETSADWEASFEELTPSENLIENIIMVARSQIGVTESTRNFQVDEFGVRRGITRYGQWYGNPYGDWSAMFVSFCLEYADAEDLPRNAGVEAMRLEWEEEQLYVSADEQLPAPGQLVFLDKDEDGEADSVAIITAHVLGEENENVIFAVEGDLQEPITQIGTVFLYPEEESEGVFVEMAALEDAASAEEVTAADMVAETLYSVDDPAILGYGLVPERAPDKVMMMSPAPRAAEKTYLGRTINYSNNMFTSGRSFVIYAQHNDEYYAFVSNPASGMENTVAAVPIQIDENGNIYAEGVSADNLLWNFTRDGNSGSNYKIQNAATGRYLHPGGDYGIVYDGDWPTALVADGTGAKLRHTGSNDVAIAFDGAQKIFKNVAKNQATTLYFGVTEQCTVWLDGTDGGIASLGGSPNQQYNVEPNTEFTLPTEWTSPSKYSYKLRGWYDVTHSQYYLPGAVVPIEETTVFYADWVASTYDIGVYNIQVANTVSTDSFITTHMFDYNYLFNIHSSKLNQTRIGSTYSDNWEMVTSGNVAHGGQPTFDFIFVDNDTTGRVCIPEGRSDRNVYPGAGVVTPGIYSAALAERLFATDNCYNPETKTGILGKTYLGTGDHLFQIMNDQTDEHYGYYYYDSARNAASYNQSNHRFYVYEYLEATSDAIGSTNSDFLPLNSPYANTNGKIVGTYDYEGVNGEYQGTTHYRYDSKYNSGNYNSVNNVTTDYAYGMRSDIQFYLPNNPGEGGNKDLYGNDMQFQFSGDDDLWVLIDEQLVLDIGGIHGAEDGVIDFSTGQITVQGEAQTSLMDLGIGAGDHTLSVLYLERGSSLSNCSIYFNLAPRFSLVIQKEDVLTQQLLDGTQFTVYEDINCTKPAVLWESEKAYQQDRADGKLDAFQSTFTVTGGTANMWGLGSGNTYYIKETGAPHVDGYGVATGLIKLTLSKDGQATYNAEVIPEADGTEPSNGFTIHGIRIDEATKTVYLTATNAPETVTETTTVQVVKKWEDDKQVDHSNDYITAYLTVINPDGTSRRIREVILSDENDWQYMWTNLPKYNYEELTEITYGIEESYESGYYSTVRQITEISITTSTWAEAYEFKDGQTYVLKTSSGCLATTSATNTNLKWITDVEAAKQSPLALWTATKSNNNWKFTNGYGHILGGDNNGRNAQASATSGNNQNFTQTIDQNAKTIKLRIVNGDRYYLTRNISNGKVQGNRSSSSAVVFTPLTLLTTSDIKQVENWGYQITNTPLAQGNETSLTVQKEWVLPEGFDKSLYEESAVVVRLLADGVNTGRTLTLTLKNGWKDTFLGLPYKDADGSVIVYTVEELWEQPDWKTSYAEVKASEEATPQYSTTITNTYHRGGPMLPSTGTAARMLYVLFGGGMMLTSLGYGILLRCRRERRRHKPS